MYTLDLEGYLIVGKAKQRYGKLTGKFVTKSPALASNEIAIKVKVSLPEELFTRPQLKFNINIPEEAVPQKEIDAEVIGNIKELVEVGLGMEIHLISNTN